MGKILIVDIDSVPFYCAKETWEESVEALNSYMENLLNFINPKEYYLFGSSKPYFRSKIYPDYKKGRKVTLEHAIALLKYCYKEYSVHTEGGLEADDLCCIYKEYLPEAVVASGDKDVLNANVGTSFNLRTFETTEVTAEKAEYWKWLQCLTGDSADNIKGIPGIGIKKALKILDNIKPEDRHKEVLDQYMKYFGQYIGVSEFYKNFMSVRMVSSVEEYKFVTKKDKIEWIKAQSYPNYLP